MGRDLLANGATRAARGAGTAAVDHLLRVFPAKPERAGAEPLGVGTRLSVPAAALVTGAAMDAASEPGTAEDEQLASERLSDAVVAGAVAVAQYTRASGSELVAAITVGGEAALRLAQGLGAEHRARGWDVAGTAGPPAVVVAVGRLLGLAPHTLSQAIGIAATQGSGLVTAHGTMARSLHVGRAAAVGLEAALFASQGLTGPTTGIEGRRGLVAVAAPQSDLTEAGRDLGEEWWLTRTARTGGAADDIDMIVTDLAADRCGLSALISVLGDHAPARHDQG